MIDSKEETRENKDVENGVREKTRNTEFAMKSRNSASRRNLLGHILLGTGMLVSSLGGTVLTLGISSPVDVAAQTRKVKMGTSAKPKVQSGKKSKTDSTHRQLSSGEIELAFRGCVHDGGDAVLIFSLVNSTDSDLRCRLGKSDLEALHVVGSNGRVFTDVDCYVDAKVVSSHEKATSFDIKHGERRLISMVVHNVPNDLHTFSDVDMPVNFMGEGEQLFHFDNIDVLSEKTVKAMTR